MIAQGDDHANHRGIVGVWSAQATLRNCQTNAPLGPPINALLTFHADGTLSESLGAISFAPGQRTEGHGSWRRIGRRTYTFSLAALLLFAFVESRRDPVVRRATLALPDWPHGAPPIRVALVSDLHLGNASTDVARLTRIADQVSARRPDLILLAGDFVAGGRRESVAQLAGPLAHLHAPLGVVAVPGNHDTREAMRRAFLARATEIADPDFIAVPVETLTSKAHADALARSIDDRATPSARLAPFPVAGAEPGGHTTHLSTIDAQGSAGSLAPPACNSSIEMLSGVRTKAMCPSRGGRLIVTPASISRWHVA